MPDTGGWPELTVRVDASMRFSLDQAPPDLVRRLDSRLTYANPLHGKAKAAGRWAGATPQHLRYLRRATVPGCGTTASLPRGCLALLRRTAWECQVRLVFDSAVQWDREAPGCDLDDLAIPLRPYQVDAVNRLRRDVQGYLVLPCGAGKTVTAASAALTLGQRTLVVVHTTDLLDQWRGAFHALAEHPVRPFGAGEGHPAPMRQGEVVIAMLQALVAADQGALGLVRSAGTVIVDEAHHVAADSFLWLLNRCPARYRWGLTATPERVDGLGFVLPLYLGPQLLRRTSAELVAAGYLVSPTIVGVRTGYTPGPKDYGQQGRLVYARAVSRMEADPDRTNLVADLTSAAVEDNRTTLVLMDRVRGVHRVVQACRARGISCAGITGQTSRGERQQRVRQLRERRLGALVATQLADEGLDVPVLECLVLAAAGRAAGRAAQRVGRTMRPAGRPPVVLDLVDAGPFLSQWYARARAYRDVVGVDPGRVVDPEQALALLAAA